MLPPSTTSHYSSLPFPPSLKSLSSVDNISPSLSHSLVCLHAKKLLSLPSINSSLSSRISIHHVCTSFILTPLFLLYSLSVPSAYYFIAYTLSRPTGPTPRGGLARLRIAHTQLTHGHLMTRSDPPRCLSCHVPLSVVHLLIDCPIYASLYRSLFPSMQSLSTLGISLSFSPSPQLSTATPYLLS